jgi:prevent-host-death family protein
MSTSINSKMLRASLPDVVRRVKKGARFTVIYRSRPAFRIVPLDDTAEVTDVIENDPLFEAGAVGHSADGHTAAEHDDVLYPK